MLASGMIEETQKVLAMGVPPSAPGLQSLGYREIIEYLEGRLQKTDVRELLQRATRHYAKRQLTWFKRDPRICWIPTTDNGISPEEAAASIAKIIGI
jgi:tRNA dimethylallyltransferase